MSDIMLVNKDDKFQSIIVNESELATIESLPYKNTIMCFHGRLDVKDVNHLQAAVKNSAAWAEKMDRIRLEERVQNTIAATHFAEYGNMYSAKWIRRDGRLSGTCGGKDVYRFTLTPTGKANQYTATLEVRGTGAPKGMDAYPTGWHGIYNAVVEVRDDVKIVSFTAQNVR